MSVSGNMELRHLDIAQTSQLSQILDRNDSWKSLMEKIPRDLDEIQKEPDSIRFTRKYSAENIQQIDETSKQLRRSPTSILLDEWGTSGRKRATLNDLLNLLVKVQLYRAAEFVATILNVQPPKRPETGPGARIDISLPPETYDKNAIENFLNNADYPNSSGLVEQLDSIMNNNNRDFSNSVSVDHVKEIREFFPTSSEENSESDTQSDFIVFSTGTVSNSDNNNDEQRSHRKVLPSKQPTVSNNNISKMTSNNLSRADSNSDYSGTEDQLPDIPNISALKLASSEQYSFSNNVPLIPDIRNLQIHEETKSSSALSSSNVEIDAPGESPSQAYIIPNLSLLKGTNS